MRSTVEYHDRVPSFPDNLKSQTHSAGVQTDLSQVVHSSCRSFATHLNHKVPLYVSPVLDQMLGT